MQLLVMLLYALGMLVVATGITFVLTLAGVDTQSASGIRWTQAVTQLLTFLLPVVLMTLTYYRGSQREFYALDFAGRKWVLALAAVVMFLLLMPVIDWLTVWNDIWHWQGAWAALEEQLRSLGEMSSGIVERLLNDGSVGGLVANLVVVALIPAVCEEVFFRAGVQNLLQRWVRNPHVAVWIAAAIFSLAHGEVFAFLPRFLMGAVLGYLYIYSRSILVNSAVHFFNNAFVVVAYWLSARGIIDFDPEAPLAVDGTLTACCTLAAAGILYASFIMPSKKGTVE